MLAKRLVLRNNSQPLGSTFDRTAISQLFWKRLRFLGLVNKWKMYLSDFLVSFSPPLSYDGNSMAKNTLKLSSKVIIVLFYSSFIGKTCQWPIPSRQSQRVFQGQPSLPDSGDESWCTCWIYFIHISLWRRAKALHGNLYQLVWYQMFVFFFATDAALKFV